MGSEQLAAILCIWAFAVGSMLVGFLQILGMI
jgi:hypothetical protein